MSYGSSSGGSDGPSELGQPIPSNKIIKNSEKPSVIKVKKNRFSDIFLKSMAGLLAFLAFIFAISSIGNILSPYINERSFIVSVPELIVASIAAEYPEKADDVEKLYVQITKLTDQKLTILSVLPDPCSRLQCMSLNPDTTKRLVTAVIQERQNKLTLKAANDQATGALGSLAVAVVAVIVSFVALFISKK